MKAFKTDISLRKIEWLNIRNKYKLILLLKKSQHTDHLCVLENIQDQIMLLDNCLLAAKQLLIQPSSDYLLSVSIHIFRTLSTIERKPWNRHPYLLIDQAA